jgi:polyhydroxybutyrate depolymerase
MNQSLPMASILACCLIGTGLLPAQDFTGKSGTFANESIKVGSVERFYRLVVPESVDLVKPAPIVFAFHGYGIDSKDFMPRYSKLDELAAKHHCILVYPNALDRHWGLQPEHLKGDIAFFDALLESLMKKYRIDDKRIYVTGMSNGGYMAYEAGNARSTKVAAVAAHSTSLAAPAFVRGIHAERKYPVMIIHGDVDGLLSVDLGRKTRDLYQKEGHEVKYVEVPGLQHMWANKVDINEQIWKFFEEHPLPKK